MQCTGCVAGKFAGSAAAACTDCSSPAGSACQVLCLSRDVTVLCRSLCCESWRRCCCCYCGCCEAPFVSVAPLRCTVLFPSFISSSSTCFYTRFSSPSLVGCRAAHQAPPVHCAPSGRTVLAVPRCASRAALSSVQSAMPVRRCSCRLHCTLCWQHALYVHVRAVAPHACSLVTAGASFATGTPCPAGTYSNVSGATGFCPQCLPGSFSVGTGNANCAPCPAGRFTPSVGSSLSTSCQNCTAAAGFACQVPVRVSWRGPRRAPCHCLCHTGVSLSHAVCLSLVYRRVSLLVSASSRPICSRCLVFHSSVASPRIVSP